MTDAMRHVTVTADEFERGYAERSNITVEQLRRWQKVVPCDCDYEECEGWGEVTLNSDTCGECGHYNHSHRDSGGCPCGTCPGFTRERRWPR